MKWYIILIPMLILITACNEDVIMINRNITNNNVTIQNGTFINGTSSYLAKFNSTGNGLINSSILDDNKTIIRSLIICDNGTATIMTRNVTLAQSYGCTI